MISSLPLPHVDLTASPTVKKSPCPFLKQIEVITHHDSQILPGVRTCSPSRKLREVWVREVWVHAKNHVPRQCVCNRPRARPQLGRRRRKKRQRRRATVATCRYFAHCASAGCSVESRTRPTRSRSCLRSAAGTTSSPQSRFRGRGRGGHSQH